MTDILFGIYVAVYHRMYLVSYSVLLSKTMGSFI
jgi:hypothetical protein